MKKENNIYVLLITLIILIGFSYFVIKIVRPAAAKELYIFTGPAESQEYALGVKYKLLLESYGLNVYLTETEGSQENLSGLQHTELPSIGLVQAINSAALFAVSEKEMELESLGSLYPEPLWMFYRKGLPIHYVHDLKDLKVGLGPENSTTRTLTLSILHDNQILEENLLLPYQTLSPNESADALIEGSVDAAFFLGTFESPYIKRLVADPNISPFSMTRAASYAQIHPYLGTMTVPEGVIDFKNNIPEEDIELVSTVVNLVSNKYVHPIVIDLLLESSQHIHRQGSLYAAQREFPNTEYVSLPLSPVAERFYRDGPNKFYSKLPFRLASLLNRLLVIGIPIVTVAAGVFKLLVMVVRVRINFLLKSGFKTLEKIEKMPLQEIQKEETLEIISSLEKQSAAWSIPKSYLSSYFEFRQAMHDQKERVQNIDVPGEV